MAKQVRYYRIARHPGAIAIKVEREPQLRLAHFMIKRNGRQAQLTTLGSTLAGFGHEFDSPIRRILDGFPAVEQRKVLSTAPHRC